MKNQLHSNAYSWGLDTTGWQNGAQVKFEIGIYQNTSFTDWIIITYNYQSQGGSSSWICSDSYSTAENKEEFSYVTPFEANNNCNLEAGQSLS